MPGDAPSSRTRIRGDRAASELRADFPSLPPSLLHPTFPSEGQHFSGHHFFPPPNPHSYSPSESRGAGIAVKPRVLAFPSAG